VIAGHPSRLRPQLTVASQQDTDCYDAEQSKVNAGGSFGFGSMTASAYLGE